MAKETKHLVDVRGQTESVDTKQSGQAGEFERIKVLEREITELRRANEILRNANAFFAHAEISRNLKK